MPSILANAVAVSTTDIESILTTIQGQISVSNIVGVLAMALGAAVGFVFMWWGIRKLIAIIMKAVKKGRLGA